MIKPARGYVLIKPLEAEEQTAKGVYLPKDPHEKPQKGVVVAVGEQTKDATPPCSAEETVFYKRWGTEDIRDGGEEFVIVKFDDILAVYD